MTFRSVVRERGAVLLTAKTAALIGGGVGLVVSAAVLALLWFGVAGVLGTIGQTDLMFVLWPSSFILLVGWHSTIRGIMMTVFSVATNCLLYSAIALLLRACIRQVLQRVGLLVER
jgi:hypothetical protein